MSSRGCSLVRPYSVWPKKIKKKIYIYHLTIYIIMMETFIYLFIVLWEYHSFILVDKTTFATLSKLRFFALRVDAATFWRNVKLRVWTHSRRCVSGQASVHSVHRVRGCKLTWKTAARREASLRWSPWGGTGDCMERAQTTAHEKWRYSINEDARLKQLSLLDTRSSCR